MARSHLHWWGWGRRNHRPPLEENPDFWPTIQKWLALPDEVVANETPPVPLDEITLRPTRLDDPVLVSLRRLLGDEAVRVDKPARVGHAYGKSYGDLVRLRAGYVPNPPDAVAYPADQRDVAALLSWAAERDIALIPYGGGTSTTGRLEPPTDGRPVVTLDLSHLNQVLSVDVRSRTARVQAGIDGPSLEAHLNDQGLTLGHFPQSFEFSTLGGWVATRSVGQQALTYGTIDTLVQAVRVVTPVGILTAGDSPVEDAGPNLLQLLIGSEGAYGVITEAVLRLRPLPAVRDYRGVLFESWEEGLEAVRVIVQESDLRPALIALFDHSAVAAYTLLNHEQRGLRRMADALGRYIKPRRADFSPGDRALLLLGFEGEGGWTAQQWRQAGKICDECHSISLLRNLSQHWARMRYALPYLRDILISHSVLVGTLGTAATWASLPRIYATMVGAMKGAVIASGGGPGYVMAHLSHACAQGAAIQATFLGRQVGDGDPLALQAQWETVRQAVAEAVVSAGGRMLSYNGLRTVHTLPDDRTNGLRERVLRSIKESLDPLDILWSGDRRG